jgi:hypothetical protein
MEPGFLAAEALVQGARWAKQKTLLNVAGDSIAKPDLMGNVYIVGFRCRICRRLALRY